LSALATYKFRLRDRHAAELCRQARAVNFCWNFCNETQQKAAQSGRKWLTAVDLMRLTAGASSMLDIHAHTIQKVCQQYDRARSAKRKRWLRWRGRKSLGWIPFNTGHVSFDGEGFTFRGQHYTPMHMREMAKGVKIAAGSFNQDSKGRWYINCPVDVETANQAPITKIGIDLGLKDFATLSDGGKVGMPRFYRESEVALGVAQRARKTKRARAISAKVANRRRDFMHKASSVLAKQYGLIVIGDVSPSKLTQTSMAKSVLDAGWATFKYMLSYKAIRHGGSVIEVSEYLTTQTCSECGSLPSSRPKGIAGLSKRSWACDDCGTVHDRDVNAARNILRVGQHTLSEGARLGPGVATQPSPSSFAPAMRR
jgi:putative transposase